MAGSISVLVFSKDRPFQLGQYLRTLFHYSGDQDLKVSVLVRVQADYEQGYKILAAKFPHVTFIRETDFGEQLVDLVQGVDEEGFVTFGVDDALFCAAIPWSSAAEALAKNPAIQCVHLKLSPGICYCHPAGSIQVLKYCQINVRRSTNRSHA